MIDGCTKTKPREIRGQGLEILEVETIDFEQRSSFFDRALMNWYTRVLDKGVLIDKLDVSTC